MHVSNVGEPSTPSSAAGRVSALHRALSSASPRRRRRCNSARSSLNIQQNKTMSAAAATSSTASAASELKKAVAAKEREVDYKITHYASFADNIEQVCERDTSDNVCRF